ncbi:MAG: AAA family ATPase [Sporocytophaga sp.]|uniref:DUF6371 domain-containing protein n=1 Tax=Sporocytophaga sp. TaxID=2231183 RepID=UPI001B08CC1F|nr:DUF6371 domain-containing protein [Sporocytophaga sp.]MBO9699257.1 AAA family ATPase [Sporocytophaga sp.]
MRFEFEESPSPKGQCPKCGHNKEFRYYKGLSHEYGKCERINNCGYHNDPRGKIQEAPIISPKPDKKVVYPDPKDILRIKNDITSPFHLYCESNLGFNRKEWESIGVGTKDTLTAFIYKSKDGKDVNVKFIEYNEIKRNKSKNPFSLKPKEGEQFQSCLFLEHLLSDNKTICLVESEKTAIIARKSYPQFDWLATGGSNGLTDKNIHILFNRKVFYIQDADKAGRENSTIKKLQSYKIDHSVVDLFQGRTDSYDLADAIIEGCLPEIKELKNDTSSKFNNCTLTTEELYEKYKDFQLRFTWENFIVQRANNFLTAEGGTGKTRLGLSLAMALKYGYSEYLGNKLDHEGNVLYLNYEITEDLFKEMVEPIERNFIQKSPRKINELFILSFAKNRNLTIDEVSQIIEDRKIKLVIIDSFKACVSRLMRDRKQRELNNLNADLYFDVLNSWREKHGVTTLTINHTNKGAKNQKTSGDLGFGPSAIRDFMDYQIFLRYAYDQERTERLLIIDKARFLKRGRHNKLISLDEDIDGSVFFQLIEEHINEEDFINGSKPSHEKTDEIINLLDQGKKYKEIQDLLHVSPKVVAQVNEYRKMGSKGGYGK